MSRTYGFSIQLRGQTCEVEGEICPAEPDVGIFSPYFEGFTVKDEEGREITDLTEEEERLIDRHVTNHYDSDRSSGWDDNVI